MWASQHQEGEREITGEKKGILFASDNLALDEGTAVQIQLD